jgi:hypothetical protein
MNQQSQKGMPKRDVEVEPSRAVDRFNRTGVHAAAFATLIRASRRRDAWLGGAAEGEDSFPQTDGEHLAADRIFFAALTSRS